MSHVRGAPPVVVLFSIVFAFLVFGCVSRSAASGVYTVKSGDSAWSIAERHQIEVRELLAQNNLSSRSTLQVGQQLRLPSRFSYTTYKLRRGDTISSVADRFGVSPATLISENGISNPRRLREGIEIRIPGATPTTPSPTPAEVTTPKTHKVARGQNLTAIANRYGVSVSELARANGLANANRLEVGMVLQLPGSSPLAAPATVAPVTPATHTVRRGEYLAGIAEKYDVSVTSLKSENGIRNANRLSVGQVLRIPGRSTGSSPATTVPAPAVELQHKVRRGEYLAVIAQKYGVTVKSLIDRNSIRDARRIIPGTILAIPGVTSSGSSAVASSSALPKEDVVHVVKRGEFLVAIADRYGVSHQAIQTVNRLSDPRRISPGQRLVIPLSGNITTPRPVSASVSPAAYTSNGSAATSSSSSGSRYHRVRRGESLARLATKYGVSVVDLQRANRISNRNLIVPGQVLRIPEASSTSGSRSGWSLFGGRRRGPELPSTIERRLEGIRVNRGVWRNIVLHHTATDSGSVSGLDRFHRLSRRMQNGLAYHFLIGNGNGMRDGEIHVGDRWSRQIAGGHLVSSQLNANSIGICLVGNFEKGKPTAKQMESVVALLNWLTDEYNISTSRITTHTLIHPNHTLCPGKHFPLESIRSQVQ